MADSVAGEGVGADAVTERGIAYGVAQILNVKIAYKCKNIPSGPGGLREDDVLAGLQFAVFDAKHVASIVNLSLAGVAPVLIIPFPTMWIALSIFPEGSS